MVSQCVASIAPRNCQMYVMVGEASVKEITPKGVKDLDCILVSGETRDGTVLAIMTPYVKDSNQIQFGNTKWFEDKKQIDSFAQIYMFKGIFGSL